MSDATCSDSDVRFGDTAAAQAGRLALKFEPSLTTCRILAGFQLEVVSGTTSQAAPGNFNEIAPVRICNLGLC